MPPTLLSLISILTLLLTAEGSVANGPDCKDYVLIVARGVGESQGPSPSVSGMVKRTLDAVSDGKKVDVTYPATLSVVDQAQGVDWVLQYIHHELQTCPKQKIALVAYCVGSTVHSMAAADLLYSPAAKDAIKAFVFTGSPIHSPYRRGNVDEKGGDSNAGASGETSLDYPDLFDRYVETGRVLSICNTGDIVCDVDGKGGIAAHRQYGNLTSVQNIGAQFLIKHLRD